MICWKPNNLIFIFLPSMAKGTNYTWNTLLQAEGTHVSKITHSFFAIKDAVDYEVIHCAAALRYTVRFNFFSNSTGV